ncbi:MAG: bifunctional DNA-formamidopyrimidine glycosylase/DNA-(apurinic or apyrimidinic site) lyase [Chloroflexi bacterium]|nr:bifunctional DNA-formamidopyrimidine glycosylase/DNA-(apurinic or apyrimidinic site) lyase [Chloroflexota bacterium]
MPELPEVQRAADSLAAQVCGATIAGLHALDWPRALDGAAPDWFARHVGDRTVQAVGRRAKWIVVTLDGGWWLAIHLRMSGRVSVVPAATVAGRHTRWQLRLADGRLIQFDDPRKFGRLRLLDAAGLAALDAAHGVEPLTPAFTAAALRDILAARSRAIKPLLLDQQLIAGVGNIYADEALWRAAIHPQQRADRLDAPAWPRLHEALVAVLRAGIAHGGSTLRDYRDAYGQPGAHQHEFRAYGRAGAPCGRCATPIVRIVVAQRGTHLCPRCQPCPA